MKNIIIIFLFLFSCSTGPLPIMEGRDQCQGCKMTIVDKRFSTEIVTRKNKTYKFDDVKCMVDFMKSGSMNTNEIKEIYFVNYSEKGTLLNSEQAVFLKSSDLHSPMNGNVAAFASKEEAEKVKAQKNGEIINREDVLNNMKNR